MASIVKMRGTEVGQKVTELAVEAVGWYGAPFTELRNYDSNVVPVGGDYVDDVSPRYFNTRKTTIYGGSSEVQRNVLAKAMLGLQVLSVDGLSAVSAAAALKVSEICLGTMTFGNGADQDEREPHGGHARSMPASISSTPPTPMSAACRRRCWARR